MVGESNGYAIFAKDDLQLIEYSPYGSSPFSEINKAKIRYAGPANYYVEEGSSVKNLNTNDVISNEKLVDVASVVRNKTKIKVEQVKDLDVNFDSPSIEAVSDSGLLSAGVGGEGYKYFNEYPIVNQKLISDYEYFLNGVDYALNNNNSCVTVATQILLGYNNWSKYGKLIINPNYLLNTNSTNLLTHYNIENKSTSSNLLLYIFKIKSPGLIVNNTHYILKESEN